MPYRWMLSVPLPVKKELEALKKTVFYGEFLIKN